MFQDNVCKNNDFVQEVGLKKDEFSTKNCYLTKIHIREPALLLFLKMQRHECKNCSELFVGNYCPNCGQNAHEHRVNAEYFLHDIPHSVFHVDHGFFYTLKMLFTRPGQMIQDYLEGKRIRYFRPIGYVMVMTALSTLLVKFIDWLTAKSLEYNGIKLHESHNFFEHYFSVFIFLMIPLASLVTWLFFVRKKYNFWEHFLANTYIAAQLNIMWILMHLIGLISAFVTSSQLTPNYTFFLIFFLIFFMYLYGTVFGFLMMPSAKSKVKLIISLSVMNMVLSALYSYGFQITGLIESGH